ncbi:MAG: sigma 54-interacting transcriptional regulator [Gemmatimonadaceae bacterium]
MTKLPVAAMSAMRPTFHEEVKARTIERELGGRSAPFPSAESPAMIGVMDRIEAFAHHPWYTVLLEGESGTGKSYLARYLHDRSPRRTARFQRISVATLSETLAQSDLFGYVKGSFTGSTANRSGHFVTAEGGTLFLDEIGSASTVVQGVLLTVVEDGVFYPLGVDDPVKVDVRIIAANNVPLASLVAQGRFREDLMYRLCGLRIVIPPLRQRREDIPPIVNWYIAKHARDAGYQRTLPVVESGLMSRIQGAEFPGNIRAVENLVVRLLLTASGAHVITEKHCVGEDAYLRVPVTRKRRAAPKIERVRDAMTLANGKKVVAAARLGCARTTLDRVLASNITTVTAASIETPVS